MNRAAVALASCLALSGCLFGSGALPGDGRIACSDDAECNPEQRCVFQVDAASGRCLSIGTPCIDTGTPTGFLPDGSPCGDGGLLCIAQACVPPRCGDGVVSTENGEECDAGPANSNVAPSRCHEDCLLPVCGDGLQDTGETCDDGNQQGADGCAADCGKVEECGDGFVDDGEACDDANDNPRDGCVLCRSQLWSSSLVVSGSIEGRAATATALAAIGATVDPLGRVYVVGTHRVWRIEVDGGVTVVAGSGVPGFSGDGGPATSARLNGPSGVAVDPLGRVLIADQRNHRIRRVERDGTLTTFVGTGLAGFSGDDGPAETAQLHAPQAVFVDALGRLFIADRNNMRIRRVDVSGVITTVAGTGVGAFSGDGSPALETALFFPSGVAVDRRGRVLVADQGNARIRRIDTDGTVETIAGTGVRSFAGDGGPATAAMLNGPSSVAVDTLDRIFIADTDNHRVRRMNSGGTITTVVGSGVASFSGDGGPAGAAALSGPTGVVVDDVGRLLIVDAGNSRIRRLENDGTIVTLAGTGASVFSGDGGPATSVALDGPRGLAIDPFGRLFLADPGHHRVLRVEPDGTLKTVAGTGVRGFAGDGGAAPDAKLSAPGGVAVDDDGQVFIADTDNHRVRRVGLDGTIVTIAGTGSAGFSGDDGPATMAALRAPRGIAVDELGGVLIADADNHRVRRVGPDGRITTVAGSASAGFSGDGGPANEARLRNPTAVTVDDRGRILIADSDNGRVRRIDIDGTIDTIAGGNVDDVLGDGGPAEDAALGFPAALAVAPDGRVLVADLNHHRLRSIGLDRRITTIAGPGSPGFLGDGGPATSASLDSPSGVAVDVEGRVVIADQNNNRVRRIEPDGSLRTLVGAVHPPGPGAVDRARLYAPAALVALPTGDVVSVGALGRALRIDFQTRVVDVVVGYPDASPDVLDEAPFAPLLEEVGGAVVDPVAMTLLLTEQDSGDIRVIGLDTDGDGAVNAAHEWTSGTLATGLRTPTGLAYDAQSDTFFVVEHTAHCVQRIDRDGAVLETVLGRCGTAGVFPGLLHGPTHVAVSSTSGALYVSDTDNQRVLRLQAGNVDAVVGDGSVSSAGEGKPARLFPVDAPRQLALDAFGNLYVASTTTVRLVQNIDGDDDADGDDRVVTMFGGGNRGTFPESDAYCLGALALDDSGAVYVADRCQGFLVRLDPTPPAQP